MKQKISFIGLGAVIMLSGCVHMPTAPSVMVLPGSRMTFDQFRQDDYACQQFASAQMGGSNANQAAADSQVATAVAGTAVGAAAGAAFDGGSGAAIGAGAGLVAGSALGVSSGRGAAMATQEGYDNAYIQCMYAKGHRVPVSGQLLNENQQPTQRQPVQIPPPPPGTPPPPPPLK